MLALTVWLKRSQLLRSGSQKPRQIHLRLSRGDQSSAGPYVTIPPHERIGRAVRTEHATTDNQNGMTTRTVMLPLALALAVTLWVSQLGDAAKASDTEKRSHAIWITAGWSLSHLDTAAPRASRYAFDNPRAIVLGNEDASQNQVPPDYASLPMLKYESFARFRDDLLGGHIDPTIAIVGYDPENWPLTPLKERQNPIAYMTKFAKLAHSYDYTVFESPARDLMLTPGAHCSCKSGERLSHAYLRCGLAEAAALSGEIIDIQSQRLERDEYPFTRFVARAMKQARAANPSVVVLAGLSTSPGYVATNHEMISAWSGIRKLVDGGYLTINATDMPTAVAFFRSVRSRGY